MSVYNADFNSILKIQLKPGQLSLFWMALSSMEQQLKSRYISVTSHNCMIIYCISLCAIGLFYCCKTFDIYFTMSCLWLHKIACSLAVFLPRCIYQSSFENNLYPSSFLLFYFLDLSDVHLTHTNDVACISDNCLRKCWIWSIITALVALWRDAFSFVLIYWISKQ